METQDSERSLALKAGQGDEAAFEALFHACHERVYAVTYRFCGNPEDATEMAQQVWVKVWKKLDTYRGESKFFTWLYRVTTFHCLDEARKKKRKREVEWKPEVLEESVEPGGTESSLPGPDEVILRREIKQAFDQAVQTLKPEHRMALILREVDGLSYDEIAESMDCKRGTVMSRIYYARQAVQDCLKEWVQ